MIYLEFKKSCPICGYKSADGLVHLIESGTKIRGNVSVKCKKCNSGAGQDILMQMQKKRTE